MDHNKIISVIVPVYNVEKYLPECMDSIIGQTYRDLEILLIDDGSTDNSGRICDEYAGKDNRVKVIHQSNGGAAGARNAGLKLASGEYLALVDSDDYLERDAYEYMLGILEKYNADVVQCGFRNIYKDHAEDKSGMNELTEFHVKAYLERYTVDWTCGLAWDKLFRRKIFKDIFYETGHRIDDEFFTYQGVMNAGKIVYSPKITYNYRQRASSVMQDFAAKEKMLLDRLDYTEKRRKNVSEKYPELKRIFDYSMLDSLLVWSRDSVATEKVMTEIRRQTGDYVAENGYWKYGISFGWKIWKLLHTSPQKLLQKKQPAAEESSKENYFE